MSVERTLHHFPLDPASRQVRLALGEKRLPFVEIQVRYWEIPPEFTALNPSGMPPVLVETRHQRNLVVCETRAILEHIEETEPEPPLLGRDPAERAEANRRRPASGKSRSASSSRIMPPTRPVAPTTPTRGGLDRENLKLTGLRLLKVRRRGSLEVSWCESRPRASAGLVGDAR